MVLGHLVEEALVGLLMERPPPTINGRDPDTWIRWSIDGDGDSARANWGKQSCEHLDGEKDEWSIDDLRSWINKTLDDVVEEILRRAKLNWEELPFRSGEGVERLDAARIRRMISSGLELQLEEVKACLEANGGTYRDQWFLDGDPHEVPSPCWYEHPFDPSERRRRPSFEPPGHITHSDGPPEPLCDGKAWDARSAWEIARPWAKDPRIISPQRLVHPDRWASGELDLALRWKGTTTIVDIKASAGTSVWSAGVGTQLRFYRWLWNSCQGNEVKPACTDLEAWFLDGPHRTAFEDDLEEDQIVAVQHEQIASNADRMPPAKPSPMPECSPGGIPKFNDEADLQRTCELCSANFLCDARSDDERSAGLRKRWKKAPAGNFSTLCSSASPSAPATPISSLPRRLNASGSVLSSWGPFANQYGEEVHGLVFGAEGGTTVLVEEADHNANPNLKETGGEVIFEGALPGQWRGRPRLYIDSETKIHQGKTSQNLELTPLGLLPTKASVEGVVISRGLFRGHGRNGRPWSIESTHIWDGTGTIELVAFGRARRTSTSDFEVGSRIRIQHAELGWRAGLPQLRVREGMTRVDPLE